MSAPALDFILKHGDRLFPGMPIVATTSFDSQVQDLEKTGLAHRVVAVIFEKDIAETIAVIRGLKPATRRIARVGGASESDQLYLTFIRGALRQYEPELEVMDLAGLAMPQILERVSSLPPTASSCT